MQHYPYPVKKSEGSCYSSTFWVHMEIFKNYLFHVFYVALFLGGLFFSKDTVTQFLAAKTSFRAIISDIKTKDLPVTIVCYEKALVPEIRVRQNFSVTNVVLAAEATKYSQTLRSKECQKILPTKDFQLDFREKHKGTTFLDLEITSPNDASLPIDGLKLILASEDNSYGIGLFNFFDGHISMVTLQPGTHISVKITDIVEYRYVHKCSKDSYYETLAKWYTTDNWAQFNHSYQNSGEIERKPCDYKDLCLFMQLPSNITICNRTTKEQNQMVEECYDSVFGMHLQEVMYMDLKRKDIHKSCKITEYKIDAHSGFKHTIQKSKIHVELRFETSKSENRVWHRIPKKTLMEEYFIMDEIAFVGIIGGTLGLFVGLSFMDLVSVVFEAALYITSFLPKL